jgi:hypothetical protein
MSHTRSSETRFLQKPGLWNDRILNEFGYLDALLSTV